MLSVIETDFHFFLACMREDSGIGFVKREEQMKWYGINSNSLKFNDDVKVYCLSVNWRKRTR